MMAQWFDVFDKLLSGKDVMDDENDKVSQPVPWCRGSHAGKLNSWIPPDNNLSVRLGVVAGSEDISPSMLSDHNTSLRPCLSLYYSLHYHHYRPIQTSQLAEI